MDRIVSRPSRVLSNAAVVVSLVAVACESADHLLDADPSGLASIAISPPIDTISALMDTVFFTVEAFDASDGTSVVGSVDWRSSDRTVLTIDSAGVAVSRGNGQAFVSARVGSAIDSVRVIVTQQVAQVETTVDADILHAIGDTARATADLYDANGFELVNRPVQWTSSDVTVVLVSTRGVVTAVGNGTATIAAEAEGHVGSTPMTVHLQPHRLVIGPEDVNLHAIGETVQLTASAYDQTGNVVPVTAIEWTATDTSVVAVRRTGLATAVANGVGAVVGRSHNAVDTMLVTVNQIPVSMSIDPGRSSLVEGDTLHLAASVFDRTGHVVRNVITHWSVSDSSVASIDPSGVLSGLSIGTVDVYARAGGFMGKRTISVAPVFDTFGLAFSPYMDGQDPSVFVNEQQIRERVAVIAPYTRWIRTFGCGGGLAVSGAVAHEFGLKIAMGAWLGPDSVSNDLEIDCLIRRANAGEVDLAVVGGEVLLRDDLSETELIALIERVQNALPDIPVTYNDTHAQLLAHPAVIDAVDFVLANFYPYWEGIAIGDALTTLDATYRTLEHAAGDKSVMVGETGWPSCGDTIGDARPTPANATRYFYEFQRWAELNEVESFYFSAFDEAWKTVNEGPQGACWGLWNSTGQLKLPRGAIS